MRSFVFFLGLLALVSTSLFIATRLFPPGGEIDRQISDGHFYPTLGILIALAIGFALAAAFAVIERLMRRSIWRSINTGANTWPFRRDGVFVAGLSMAFAVLIAITGIALTVKTHFLPSDQRAIELAGVMLWPSLVYLMGSHYYSRRNDPE
ncbi:hypothetical protein L5876_05485 [Hyphobacterium sp. SN044]|uniref:hypothetical protein n=1 Tax=Hyphobacterium sp. SN044 TaxID=2912575 RepID=UPI001F17177E|nr:hypothetical protein [Hyphobacterium sp. SN044]MCF8879262.1 hypothetical protein [Hyphobacterium sp. SN044]